MRIAGLPPTALKALIADESRHLEHACLVLPVLLTLVEGMNFARRVN
jgi:hypothetical protein